MDKPTLIHKVLSGKANEAEKAALNAWISSDPGNAEEFEDIKLLYEGALNIEEVERDDSFYDGLRSIQDRIKALKRREKKAKFYKKAGIVALVSTIIMVVSIYLFNLNNGSGLTSEPDKMGDNTTTGILLYDNLRFEDATLESIFDILEDKYHLVFKVGSKELLSCRFTGTFYRGITVDDMIHTLAQSENFNYTVVNEKTYKLHGKGCVASQ